MLRCEDIWWDVKSVVRVVATGDKAYSTNKKLVIAAMTTRLAYCPWLRSGDRCHSKRIHPSQKGRER